jgi:type I restriction enzyme M protein
VEAAQEPLTPPLELAASPYVCGDPVRPERDDVFFGREELVDAIRRQVIHSGNVILLEGNRRAGKSSILRHLEGLGPIRGWVGIYCSLQGAEGSTEGVGVPTVEVFREIAKSIASGLQVLRQDVPLPDGGVLPAGRMLGIARACRTGISEESPFADCREYIEVALAHLQCHDRGILLMLDEFDKLQEGIDSGVTSPQVPDNIRFLVQTYPQFSAILTGSRRLKRLRDEYWSALFGLGTRFSVTALSDEAARRLVTEPVKGKLTFSNEAVAKAVELVARQPFLLQCLCSRIFELAAQLKQRSITIDVVDRAAQTLVADNEHFASLWDYAGSDRRRLILAICEREATGPDALRLGVLEERLTRLGVDVDEGRLAGDLEYLRELEVLDMGDEASGHAYTLTIPLMGQWIDRQQDFDILVSRARAQTEDEHA